MENKVKSIGNKYNWLLSFGITALLFWVVLVTTGHLLGGEYTISNGDLYSAIIPFAKLLAEKIKEGSNFYYTFHYSMGDNSALLFAFYVLSPFNVFFLFIEDAMLAGACSLIFKAGAIAAVFTLFCKHNLSYEGPLAIAVSVGYALSNYFMLMVNMNILADALYLLPLVLIFAKKMLDTGKCSGLILSYTLMFVTNFYCAYLVGLASFAYVLFYIFLKKEAFAGNIWKKRMLSYFLCVTVSVMSACAVLLPALYKALEISAVDNGYYEHKMPSLLQVISSLMMGRGLVLSEAVPFLYCGLFTLIMATLYFLNKKIGRKEKIIVLTAILLLMAAFYVKPLNLIFHMLNTPDGYTQRFSYLFNFLLAVCAIRQLRYMDKVPVKKILMISGSYLLVYGGTYAVISAAQKTEENVYNIVEVTPQTILLNAVFFLLYVLLCFWASKKTLQKGITATLLVLLVAAELFAENYRWFGTKGVGYVTTEQYDYYHVLQNGLVDRMQEEDDGIYRMTMGNALTHNSPSVYHFYGVDYFGSTFNKNLRDALYHLGYTSTDFCVNYIGRTDYTDMLFGVKYHIEVPHISLEYQPYIRQNKYALNLGYMISDEILEAKLEGNHVFSNMNSLLSAMTGEDVMVYESYVGQLEYECKNTQLYAYEDDYLVVTGDDRAQETYLAFKIPVRENTNAFAYAGSSDNIPTSDSPRILSLTKNETSLMEESCVLTSHIVEMETEGEYCTIYILFDESDASVIKLDTLHFAYYNEVDLQRSYDILSKNQLEITEFEDGYVKGTVTATEEFPILFTSVPYTIGWTAYVDGVEQEMIPLVNDAFIGLALEPGEHEIELRFTAPWSKCGIILSIIGLVLVIIIFGKEMTDKEGSKEKADE